MKQVFVGVCLVFCVSCTPRPGRDTAIAPVPKAAQENIPGLMAALTDAVEEYPRSPDAWLQRAQAYLQLGDENAALSDIEQAIRLNRNNPLYHYVKTLAYQRMGQAQPAWESALQAEKLNCETAEFYLLMGNLCQERKEYQKAYQYLKRALEINPSDGEITYFQAKIAAETGDTAKAMLGYESVLKQRPDYVETYNRLAEIANNAQVHALALSYIRDGFHQDSLGFVAKGSRTAIDQAAYAALYYNGANAYKSLAKWDTAKIWYEKAIAIKPSLYPAEYQLGLLLFNEQNYVQAQHHFEKVNTYQPGYRKLNYYIGLCLIQEGKLPEALSQFQAARKQDSLDVRITEQYQKTSRLIGIRDARQRRDSLTALLPPVRQVPRMKLEPLEPVVPKSVEIRSDSAKK